MDLLDGKKKENIGDYVISMWHIEDLMRASKFDMKIIEEQLIEPIDGDYETRENVREWYSDIIARMKEDGLEQSGHLPEVNDVLGELEMLHRSLVEGDSDEKYTALYVQASEGIIDLQKQAGEEALPPIETCFTAVYGLMVLRAKNAKIAESTLEAESSMRRLLEYLSMHYKQMRKLPGISLN